MPQVLVASTVFTGLVLLLVLVVLSARRLLLARGNARLTINGGEPVEVAVGDTLLGALDEAEVHLPTSCGGKGTCGLCRVRVGGDAGREEILPVERVALKESELSQGVRLACQFVVRGDLAVDVRPELLVSRNWECTVLQTRTLAPLMKEIVLSLPEKEECELPAGCYIIIVAPPYGLDFDDIDVGPEFEKDWQRLGLRKLRAGSITEQSRAYSLANRPGQTGQLVLNIRLVLPPASAPDALPGVVSSWLFSLKPGDAVLASGYYGDFFIQDTDREIVLIGGGMGMAPLCAHAYDQLERAQTGRKMSYWYGARSLKDLYYANEMEQLARGHSNFSWHVALSDPAPDDAWNGPRGFIHEVIVKEYLGNHPSPENCEYYLCGPPPMIHSLHTTLRQLGVPPQNIFNDDCGVY